MGCIEEAIEKHKIEIQAARQSGIIDIKDRAMDNLAVSLIFDPLYRNNLEFRKHMLDKKVTTEQLKYTMIV